MTSLILDTETSGFYTTNYPLEHPNQCRVIQVAAILVNEKFQELASVSALVNYREPFLISPGAEKVHGITLELLKEFGIPAQVAVMMIDSLVSKADQVICHNVNFDVPRIKDMEVLVFGKQNIPFGKTFCTMEAMTPVCKLPHPSGKTGFKWPKLQEAYKHFFGKEFDKAHDALSDVKATLAIYKHLTNEFSQT